MKIKKYLDLWFNKNDPVSWIASICDFDFECEHPRSFDSGCRGVCGGRSFEYFSKTARDQCRKVKLPKLPDGDSIMMSNFFPVTYLHYEYARAVVQLMNKRNWNNENFETKETHKRKSSYEALFEETYLEIGSHKSPGVNEIIKKHNMDLAERKLEELSQRFGIQKQSVDSTFSVENLTEEDIMKWLLPSLMD